MPGDADTSSSDDTVGALQAIRARLDETVAELGRARLERDQFMKLAQALKQELDALRDRMKTPREHVDADQIQLAFEQFAKELLEHSPRGGATAPDGGDGAPPPAPADPPKKKPRVTPHGRSPLPEHLPMLTLVTGPTALPSNADVIGSEESFKLGYRRGGFVRLKVLRPIVLVDTVDAPAVYDSVETKLHDGDVPAPPVTAELPPTPPGTEPVFEDDGQVLVCADPLDEMIPKGLPTCDVLAHVITGKFGDKLPFNRQEGIYKRDGVNITRGTMCGWVEKCTPLASCIVDAMVEDAIENAPFIATDATGVLVQANDKCKNGHFWVLVAGDDHVIFRYSKRHTSDEPKKFLGRFRGTVVADASNVFDQLFGLPDGPNEAGCWSHARRYFYKALGSDRDRALVAVGIINKLFDIERDIAKLPPEARLRIRKERSVPVLDDLGKWRDQQLVHPAVADGTPIRRALKYLVNHWTALGRFTTDGRIPIHNNRSELELRRLVIGRANWLFVGSDDSAVWTCTFVSLIASCQRHGLDPEAYLRDIFRLLPTWPHNRMLELAPKFWKATRARIDAAELELPLGPITIPPRPTTQAPQQADAR